MTLPNYISFFRIFLVPVFVASIVYYVELEQEVYRYTAVVVFLLASLSDMLDGYLARHYHMESRLGTILDPLADKLLLVAGVVVLSLDHGTTLSAIPIWLTTLIISRDAFLGLGAMLIVYLGRSPQVRPRLPGKLATVSQMALILWALLKLHPTGLEICIWLSGGLTLLSGIHYIHDGIRQISSEADSRESP